MRILGIDPGYAIVGIGVIDYVPHKFNVVYYGAILTNAGTPFEKRLAEIYSDMVSVIERTNPDVVSIEKLFFNTNQKTGIDVAQARGVTVLACEQRGLPIFEYTPLQVKQSVVGYGRAEKHQVMEMTKQILHLKSVPKPDDTADALALAITHAHTQGSQLHKLETNFKIREKL